MQITRGGEYGISGVLYLAQQSSDAVRMVSEIAEAQDIPPRFLAKIFQMLAKAGVIKSRRGVKGGFSLRRPASEITVKDVIEAIEGPIDLSHPDTASPVRNILDEAQEKMVRVLSRANFADLARVARQRAAYTRKPLDLGAQRHGQTPGDGIPAARAEGDRQWA